MELLQKNNQKWLRLGGLAPIVLYALYMVIGGGIKKDLLGMAFVSVCLVMRVATKCRWWVMIAQALLLLIHFYGDDWFGLEFLAAVLSFLFPVDVKFDRQYGKKLLLMGLFFAAINFLLVQDVLGLMEFFGDMKLKRKVLNLLCYMGCGFAVYTLSRSWKASVITVLLVTAFFATLDLQVYNFRGSEIKIVDIYSLGTAAQIVDNYKPEFTPVLKRSWAYISVVVLYIITRIKIEKPPKGWGRRQSAIALCICVLLVLCGRGMVAKSFYQLYGSRTNGFLLNILTNTYSLKKPSGHDSFDFAALEAAYGAEEEKTLPENAPNIVVVMNESFTDFRDFGEKFQTDVPMYTFYDSLTENTRKGRALVSVLGGNTANSEYEFFTGNSMAFLPDGIVSYLQYVDENTFALPAYLRELGYDTIAMHPQEAQNWARIRVWEQLGFDERLYIEDFPDAKIVRKYISDEAVYDKVLDTLNNRSGDKPAFVFALTMQNHGAYDVEGYESTVHLQGLSTEYPTVEQYLSMIQESDRALEGLISRLQALEEDTVLLFFGDHFPKMPETFRLEMLGSTDTTEIRQTIYKTPCFLWANFDIPEGELGMTGLNYLSIDLLELAGLPLPSYSRFLKDVRQAVPALNPLGYYSMEQQGYVSWNQPRQGQDVILDTYHILTYNSIKGGQNRSSLFDRP